jgi:hypothetical protein
MGEVRNIYIQIKMHITEIGCVGMDWIQVVQDIDMYRDLVNPVIKLRVA